MISGLSSFRCRQQRRQLGRQLLTLFFFVVFITGCASNPVLTSPSDSASQSWQKRYKVLSGIDSWKLRGRVVIKTENEGWSGAIVWQQDPDSYHIDFMTPLGQNVMRLDGSRSQVVLTLADNKEFRAADAESLLYAQLGWGLPVSTLVHWVTGIPAPQGWYQVTLDDDGRISALEQSDWHIQFKRYGDLSGSTSSAASDHSLPNKIFMNKEEISLRLVIDSWEL